MSPGVFSVPDTKGFCVSGHENFFCTGKTSAPWIGYIFKVVLMQTRHSHFYSYVLKGIASWLLWRHPRCQWLCAKTALRLGLENFIAARLDLEVIGVWLTASVYKLPVGSLTARSIGLWSAFWLLCPSAVHLSFFLFVVGNDLTS